MENTQFQQLNKTKKRAILASVIAERTKGLLSKEQIKEIVESVDISKQYSLMVTSEREMFARQIHLRDEPYREYGYHLIHSDVKFGGAEMTGDDLWKHDDEIECGFSVDQIHAVEIEEYEDGVARHRKIVIYTPAENAAQLEPEIQALVDAFRIK